MNQKNRLSRTKNVLLYARYSTDLQNEVSIEQQLAVLEVFADARGWNIVETYTDKAISGTIFHRRPGIQALLSRVDRGDIDIVLCVTVDRISRDPEHGHRILKELKFKGTALWTAQTASEVTNIDMSIRTMLSQDLIAQIRYRTLEGMAHAVRSGRAAGGISYGYRTRLIYDSKGDRIPGYREPVPEEAAIIVRIFEEYARGRSPMEIAVGLSDDGKKGPRGGQWRDTTIRGHGSRGNGIINNELYVGRIVWNRREFRKNVNRLAMLTPYRRATLTPLYAISAWPARRWPGLQRAGQVRVMATFGFSFASGS